MGGLCWKIEMGKFAIPDLRGLIISSGSFYRTIEATQMNWLILHTDTGTPLPQSFLPPDPLVASLVSALLTTIAHVLPMRTRTQIASLIIKWVVVPVIYVIGVTANEETAKLYAMPLYTTNGIAVSKTPIVLRHGFVVSGVNQCIFALGQWDKSVRLVKRLGNCVSQHVALLHVPTSNRNVSISAAILA